MELKSSQRGLLKDRSRLYCGKGRGGLASRPLRQKGTIMPRPKKRVPYQGREVEATPVSATSSAEHWNQYLLEDGTVVRMKLVATEFVRIDGEHDAEGNPVYQIRSTNVVSLEAPEELRRR